MLTMTDMNRIPILICCRWTLHFAGDMSFPPGFIMYYKVMFFVWYTGIRYAVDTFSDYKYLGTRIRSDGTVGE